LIELFLWERAPEDAFTSIGRSRKRGAKPISISPNGICCTASHKGKSASAARALEPDAAVARTPYYARRTQAHEQVALMGQRIRAGANTLLRARSTKAPHKASPSPSYWARAQVHQGGRPGRPCGLRCGDPTPAYSIDAYVARGRATHAKGFSIWRSPTLTPAIALAPEALSPMRTVHVRRDQGALVRQSPISMKRSGSNRNVQKPMRVAGLSYIACGDRARAVATFARCLNSTAPQPARAFDRD